MIKNWLKGFWCKGGILSLNLGTRGQMLAWRVTDAQKSFKVRVPLEGERQAETERGEDEEAEIGWERINKIEYKSKTCRTHPKWRVGPSPSFYLLKEHKLFRNERGWWGECSEEEEKNIDLSPRYLKAESGQTRRLSEARRNNRCCRGDSKVKKSNCTVMSNFPDWSWYFLFVIGGESSSLPSSLFVGGRDFGTPGTVSTGPVPEGYPSAP